MNTILKSILFGFLAIAAEWVYLAFHISFFNGEGTVALGVGFFLAFEMSICTGLIINSIKKNKKDENKTRGENCE